MVSFNSGEQLVVACWSILAVNFFIIRTDLVGVLNCIKDYYIGWAPVLQA
jgi:hypothetical protein